MSALESIDDKHQLVRQYASVEDSLEQFEQKVEKAVRDLDRHLSIQDDIARGK
ncbi:hypothetical protein AB0M10_09910 [Streptomyces sp. NPDC051840]|uniref:hypothetical protein n=1 Tax=Streptomyces sp. NPDC051840 TaxID=3154752 RepID=UPI003441A140